MTLFFGPFECLEVKIKPWREDIDYDADIIKVKAGTRFLERKNIEEAYGIQTLTFCSRNPGSIDKQWNLVTLGLATKNDLNPRYFARFRLVSVKAVQ